MEQHRPTIETEGVGSHIRRLGRSLMITAATAKSTGDFDDFDKGLARLQAGVDPDAIDENSSDYRAGAIDAFSVAQTAAEEMLPTPSLAYEILNQGKSRIFSAIVAGKSIREIYILETGYDKPTLRVSAAMMRMENIGLLEPKTVNEGVEIGPTNFADRVFLLLLPELAETVPMEELLQGVEAVVIRQAKHLKD